MKNLTAKTAFAVALVALVALSSPNAADAASKRDSCDFEGSAGISADSLLATSSRPVLSGVASTTRTVQIVIRKEGSEKTLYQSKVIKVKRGGWTLSVPKKLKDGEYDVEVFCPRASKGDSIATGTLVVGERATPKAGTQVTVTPVPLLMGGVAAAGEPVPVAYLNVRNTGKVAVPMKGFWIKQNGTASASAIESFTVVDGTGNSRVTTDGTFKDGVAFVKTDVSIAAGGFSLFTIKANLADSLGSSAGKTLDISVTAADGAANTVGKMPIKGVTWTLR
jgi:hypothetical protein